MGNCLAERNAIKDIVYSNSISSNLKKYSKRNKIILVGNINSGKSSLINKIIGQDLLPVDSKRETLIPLSLSHNVIIRKPRLEFIINKDFNFPVDMFTLKSENIIGDKIMYYTEDIDQLQPILSSLNKIYRIIQGKNYNDIKINIHMCIDSLKNIGIDNLQIIDSPGYNETGQQMYIQNCIKNALSNSCAVFYVIDYCSISSDDNSRMYNEIKKYNDNIFYIVNKIDIPLQKYKSSMMKESEKIDIIKSTILREMRLLDNNFNIRNMILTQKDDISKLLNLIQTNKSLKITKSFIANLVQDLIFAEMRKHNYKFIAGKKHFHAILDSKVVEKETIVSSQSIKYFLDNYDFANKEMNYFVDIILGLDNLEFNFSQAYHVDIPAFREFKDHISSHDIIFTSDNWKFYEGSFKELLPHGQGTTYYKDGSVFIKGFFDKGLLMIDMPFSLYLPNGSQIIQDGVLMNERVDDSAEFDVEII